MTATTKIIDEGLRRAQELSDRLWDEFRRGTDMGIGNVKCSAHPTITYPPNHSGKCPICDNELIHHVGF